MLLIYRSLVATLLFFASPAFSQQHCVNSRDFIAKDRIVGGRLALIDNWPGQAVLRLKGDAAPLYICGGSLITPDTILTAAHCVEALRESDGHWQDPQGRAAEVVIGLDDLTRVDMESVRGIAQIVMHEDYVSADRGNDIAIVRLQARSAAPQARLSSSLQADPNLSWVTPVMVAGFGAQRERDGLKEFKDTKGALFFAGTSRLWETTVPLATPKNCKSVYGAARVGEQQICAGFVEGGKDSCQGDSGGSLVAFDREGCPYQIGIVSWGAGCAKANAYGVYTRVSAYASWIRKHAGGVRSIGLEDVNAPTAPRSDLVESTFRELNAELPGVLGRAQVEIVTGAKLRLGDNAIFKIHTNVSGRVIVIDINALGEVAQLYPNGFAKAKQIEADGTLIIPDSNAYRFPVQEPAGRGKLVTLIVPDQFNMAALEAAKGTRGFGVEAGLSYLQNLIELIRIVPGAKGFSVEAVGSTSQGTPIVSSNWGLGELDYEIIR